MSDALMPAMHSKASGRKDSGYLNQRQSEGAWLPPAGLPNYWPAVRLMSDALLPAQGRVFSAGA